MSLPPDAEIGHVSAEGFLLDPAELQAMPPPPKRKWRRRTLATVLLGALAIVVTSVGITGYPLRAPSRHDDKLPTIAQIKAQYGSTYIAMWTSTSSAKSTSLPALSGTTIAYLVLAACNHGGTLKIIVHNDTNDAEILAFTVPCDGQMRPGLGFPALQLTADGKPTPTTVGPFTVVATFSNPGSDGEYVILPTK